MNKIKVFIISNNEVKLDASLEKSYVTGKFILLDIPGTENNLYIKKDEVIKLYILLLSTLQNISVGLTRGVQ